jgi:O-antigen biosynthesis protein
MPEMTNISMKSISIVIVNYNVKHFILQCLDSIYKSELRGFTLETYVVDNNSGDGSVNAIRAVYPEVKVIENKQNQGFSIANNQALRKIHSDYVLILNPDTILQEDCLLKCYEYMENNHDVSALGVKMIDGAGKFLPESKRAKPGIWSSICKFTGLTYLFPNSRYFSGYYMGWIDEDEVHEIDVLCGAFMFVRNESITQAGYFDEDYFMYGEDIDLSVKLAKYGKIMYFPKTRIIHFKGESTKRGSYDYVKNFYSAMGIYVRKNYRGPAAILGVFFINVAILLSAILSYLKSRLSSSYRLLLDGLIFWVVYDWVIQAWAIWYFDKPDYYDSINFYFNKSIYLIFWLVASWFFGHYEKKSKLRHSASGILAGTALILIAYALLPTEFRPSRALILLGALLIFGLILFTKFLAKKVFPDAHSGEKIKRAILISYKEVVYDIKKSLSESGGDVEIVGVVSPDNDEKDPFYDGVLKDLNKITIKLKAEEIIFSTASMSMQSIMDCMTLPDTTADYKIADNKSTSIIGSKSSTSSGEIYSLYSNFKLSRGLYRRSKRLLDVGTALFIILVIFLFWWNPRVRFLFRNSFDLLYGKRTLVGYIESETNCESLPTLRKGILTPLVVQSYNTSKSKTLSFKELNYQYAKAYSIFEDLHILRVYLTGK